MFDAIKLLINPARQQGLMDAVKFLTDPRTKGLVKLGTHIYDSIDTQVEREAVSKQIGNALNGHSKISSAAWTRLGKTLGVIKPGKKDSS